MYCDGLDPVKDVRNPVTSPDWPVSCLAPSQDTDHGACTAIKTARAEFQPDISPLSLGYNKPLTFNTFVPTAPPFVLKPVLPNRIKTGVFETGPTRMRFSSAAFETGATKRTFFYPQPSLPTHSYAPANIATGSEILWLSVSGHPSDIYSCHNVQ